jgi:hypothetical protein
MSGCFGLTSGMVTLLSNHVSTAAAAVACVVSVASAANVALDRVTAGLDLRRNSCQQASHV